MNVSYSVMEKKYIAAYLAMTEGIILLDMLSSEDICTSPVSVVESFCFQSLGQKYEIELNFLSLQSDQNL